MKRAAYLRSIALFMIVLVINLTIYSSVVLAVPIDYTTPLGAVTVDLDATVSGDDGIIGFKKPADSVNINVTIIKITEKGIAVQNFRKEQINGEITTQGQIPALQKFAFDSCEAIYNPGASQSSGYFFCLASVNYFRTQSQINVKINLNDSAGNLIPLDLANNIKTIYTDDKDPQISSFDIIQNIEGTFLVYNIGDPAPSAGIARIELREDDILINMTVLDTVSSSSSITSIKNIDDKHKITSLKRNTDNRSYELTVVDKVGQDFTSEPIYRVTDYFKPEIIQNTFGVYVDQKLIHRLDPEVGTPVTVMVNIKEDGVLPNIIANLSQLNPDLAQSLGEVTLACTRHVNSLGVFTSEHTCQTTVTAKITSSTRNIRVKLNLKDKNGNENAAEPTYELSPETTAPLFIAGSFKAVVNGNLVHHLAKNSASVTFEAKIKEEYPGMYPQFATLDLSNIDGGDPPTPAYTTLPATKCEFNASLSIYSCNWTVTGLNPKKASGIVLNVQDKSTTPKAATYPISYLFDIDDVAPEVNYVGTTSRIVEGMNATFESVMSPGKNNLFIVEITESQSGISKENVELSLLGSGGFSNEHPSQCIKKSNELFVCSWNSTDIQTTTEAEYTLQLDVTDNADNRADTKQSKVYLDNTKPVIEEVDVASISQQGPVDFHQSGDVLRVTAVVKDLGPVKMSVDLSDLNAEDNITVDCKPEKYPAGNVAIKWTCTADSRRGIGVYGGNERQQRVVGLIVKDSAGNQKNIRNQINCDALDIGCIALTDDKVNGAVVDTGTNGFLKVDVLRIDSKQPAPNFWEVGSIKLFPEALDRETFELINVRQYFSVRLNPIPKVGEEAVPVDVTLIKPSCKVDESDAGKAPFSIVKSFELQNNKGKLKDKPILFVEYQRAKPEFNDLKFTCTFSILTLTKRDGSKYFIPQPEFENVTFVTRWFDLPIGTIDAGLRDQIEDAKKKAFDDLGKTIDVLTKVMAIAKGICQLFGMFMTIVELLNVIDALGDVYRFVFPPTTTKAAEGLCIGTKYTSKVMKNSWAAFGDKFCGYVSCSTTLFPYMGELFNKLNSVIGIEKGGALDKAGLSIKPDPMKSLSLAILMGCIPGVIAAAQKHRQIHCSHAYCLQKDVAGGLPIDQCHAQKGLLECKYIYGELDSLLPWNWIIDHFANIIKTIFKDPLTMIGAATGWLCPKLCKVASTAASLCVMVDFVKISGKVFKDLDAIFQFTGKGKGGGLTAAFTPQNDMCEKLKALGDV